VRKEVDARIKARPIEECLKAYSAHFSHYMSTAAPERADEMIDQWIKFLKEHEQKIEKVSTAQRFIAHGSAQQQQTNAKLMVGLVFFQSMCMCVCVGGGGSALRRALRWRQRTRRSWPQA
jgi:hypothetical protein